MMVGTQNITVATSFTAEDTDILAVDDDYTALEVELQEEIDQIENDHPGYDEYQYDLAQIGHNPFQLAALLTVLYEDYKRDEVQGALQTIFDLQYDLILTEVVENRSREEERTGTRIVLNADGTTTTETYTYTETVYYDYYILKISLTNHSIHNVALQFRLSTDQMERYLLLLETYGNKKYLFEDNIYATPTGEYLDYDIPGEALTDARFAAMMREAEKYLGYPYVWGGSNPDTSFDCSGYVSWVVNHSGWNFGRQTANGLLQKCATIPRSEAKPGDLIFFQGTYNTSGASHKG